MNPSPMKYHYVNANNQAIGPVEDSELDDLYANGVITRDTNVVPEGSDAWRPYSSVRTLAPSPPISGPPSPPLPPSAAQYSMGAVKPCPFCDEQVSVSAKKCKHCGEILDVALRAAEEAKKASASHQPMVFMNAGGGGGGSSSSASAVGGGFGGQIVGTKSRVVAAVLAFLLGWLGIHKFYLGQLGWGIIYLLFSWTMIPFLISLLEGVLYLLSTERAFALKYG